MARKLEHNYTFTPSTNTIVLNYIYKPERILLIVNVTDNVTIFQFNDPQSGFSNVSYNYTLETTTIVVNYDCSAMSSTDKLQVWVENDAVTFEPSETFVDPVSKIRVSTPENLIDTDFEYGLQSQKWETLEQVKNIPTFFSRSGDESIELTAMTTTAGTDVVTVTTANDHSYARGIPIIVIGSKSASCDGAFVVTNVLSATVFQYKAKNTQATTGSILDTYTQLFTGSVYQGTEFDLSGISAITTDEAENSTLTVTTTFPTNFTPGTEFYLSNSISSVSQSFDAAQIQGADFTTTEFSIDTTEEVAHDDYFLTSTWDFRRYIPVNAWYFRMSDIVSIDTSTDVITFGIEHSLSNGLYFFDIGKGNTNRISNLANNSYVFVHVVSPTSISLHTSFSGASNGTSNRIDVALLTSLESQGGSYDGGITRCFFHKSYLFQDGNSSDLYNLRDFGGEETYLQSRLLSGPVLLLGRQIEGSYNIESDIADIFNTGFPTPQGSQTQDLQFQSTVSTNLTFKFTSVNTFTVPARYRYDDEAVSSFNFVDTAVREIIENPNFSSIYKQDHGLETNEAVSIAVSPSRTREIIEDFEDDDYTKNVGSLGGRLVNNGGGTGDDTGFSGSELSSTRHLQWGGVFTPAVDDISGIIKGPYYFGSSRSRGLHHAGSAWAYTSNGTNGGITVTEIDYSPSFITSNQDTTPTVGTNSAGWYGFNLGFNIRMMSSSYNDNVYIGTDGWMSTDSVTTSSPSTNNPSGRVIHVGSNSANSIVRTYFSSDNVTAIIRVQHNNLEYEWKFFSQNDTIELHIIRNNLSVERPGYVIFRPLLNQFQVPNYTRERRASFQYRAIRGSNTNGGRFFNNLTLGADSRSVQNISVEVSYDSGVTWSTIDNSVPSTTWSIDIISSNISTITRIPAYNGGSARQQFMLFRIGAKNISSRYPSLAIDRIQLRFDDPIETDILNTVEKISNDRFRIKVPGSSILPMYNLIAEPTYTFTRVKDTGQADTIFVPLNSFSENSLVTYDSNGNADVPGLTNGNDYYVYQPTSDNIKLSDQSGGLIGNPLNFWIAGALYDAFTATRTDGRLRIDPNFSLSTLASQGWANGDRVIYNPIDSSALIPGLTAGAFYYITLSTISGIPSIRLYRDRNDALLANNNYINVQWGGTRREPAGTIQRTSLVDIEAGSGIHKLVSTSPGAADSVYSISEITDSTSFNLVTNNTISSRPIPLNNISINGKDNAVYLENHGLTSGTPVTLNTTGTPPGELNDGSSVGFYVIRVSKDWIRLAPTFSDVEDDIYLALGDLGTGTNSLSTSSVSGEIVSPGTVSIQDGSNVVTGTGTNFSAQFNVGDRIKIFIDETTESISVSSAITGSDYFISSSHGLNDGDVIRCIVDNHPDIVENQLVYARKTGLPDPSNQFAVYATYNDAINGTNVIDITGSNTGSLFEKITDLGSTIESTISYVNSSTLMILTENLSTTASGLQYAVNTSLLVRANGFALHRPYDGGVELIPAENPDGQMIRQTRRYFRYQSGKGIQVSMAINFSPSVQIEEMLKISTDSAASATVRTRNPHRLTNGLNVIISGATVTSGENFWNGTFEVENVIDTNTFEVNLAGTPVDDFAQGSLEFVVESWTGGVTKAGLFDDQNGLFFEYDGQQLYTVRRSSVSQISGTCSVIFNNGAVTGNGTKFFSQVAVDDYIVIKGQTYIITEIASDQLLYIMPSYRGETNTNCIITKVVDTKIAQSSWNLDTCDGTGPTGYFLDIHKIQMAYIDYSWYGAGKARFGFKDQRGKVIYCHEFIHNNKNTEAYMRSGNLPARYEIENVGAPTYVPSLAHWGTSVIMDGGFDDDKAYVFTANSNNISVTGEATVTVSARVEDTGTFRIFDGRFFQTAGFALTIATPSPVFGSISSGFAISGSNIPAGTRVRNPQNINLNQIPYQPDVLSGIGGTFTNPGNVASRSLLIIDRQPTGTSLSNSNYTVTIGGATSVVYDQPLISIRLAPSVDTGTPGPLGSREIINRMQLILNSVGILTTHSVEISLKLNGRLNTNAWSRVTNPSLSQLIYHQNGDTITGGATIYSFRAQGTTANAGRTQAQTTEQLDEIATLGNSILGGDATFPDGPDVLTVVARLVEDPSTVSGSNPFNINGRISWSESQA